MLDETSRSNLAPSLPMCRILNGMWQVSGGHGPVSRTAAVADMLAYHRAGFTTWDLADHYGPAEDLIGAFRKALRDEEGESALGQVQAFTKWVPSPGPMPLPKVAEAVQRSLRRMELERLDLLQFHWWDYQDRRYIEALENLTRLQADGRICYLGLTNFDTERLQEIREAGILVVSNQVQYSLIDRRPEVRMAPYCASQGIGLLAYGTLCGGLLSERYLGRKEPSRAELDTVSLRKYKPMVDAWGGWDLFQDLLRALHEAGEAHEVCIGAVALRYVLDRPAVAGVIAGTRLGVSEHRAENSKVFRLRLSDEEMERIEGVLKKSRDLYGIIGDCGDEYRG